MRLTGSHATWLHGPHTLLLHSSPAEHWARTATWITAALARGEKVLYKTSATDRHAATATLVAARINRFERRSRIEVVNLQDVPGFDRVPPADALIAWHIRMLERAQAEGFTGVAVAGEQCPWPTVQGQPKRLLACDHSLDLLSRRPGVRLLCHADPRHRPRSTLRSLLRLHHRHVDDSTWGADVVEDRILIVGEIDLNTADRLGDVLDGAVREGVTTIDLSGVRLFAAAAMGVLSGLATRLERQHRALLLVDPPPLLHRTLTAVGLLDHPGLRLHRAGAADQRSLTITNEFRFSL